VLVIDEYLAIRVLIGDLPVEIDLDDTFGLPAYRHYRLLQRVHAPGEGQLSSLLSEADIEVVRRPHPEVLTILDPRPLLDDAAAIAAAYNAAGLLVGETLAAGLAHGRRLWFGRERNIGRRLAEVANDLGIEIRTSESPS